MPDSSAALHQSSAPAQSYALKTALPLGERLVRRGLLPAQAIPGILELQRRWGCRFGEALIAKDLIKPIELAETLAEASGARFVDLLHEAPDPELIDAALADTYLKTLFVPWRMIGSICLIACADPSPEVRRLIAKLYGPDARIAITGKFDVIWTVQRVFQDRLNRDATLSLDDSTPELSARRVTTPRQKQVGAVLATGLFAGAGAAPSLAAALAMLFIAVCYAANIVLRLLLFAAAAIGRGTGHQVGEAQIAALDEASLPVYSILVPLYREANMVSAVTSALKALDYPAAKLDIKIVLEQDDDATVAAAKALRLDGRFEILVVPKGELRTKPRACNYAMRFVRGAFVVIYDAEDEPEPDQLKKVVVAFRTASPDVACFQARLNVYNPNDSWLTRMFALEYAAWFDFLLPGLARLGIPIPLGGTSNHFRTDTLPALGGWDAFNVTEDADLGVRLARKGYRAIPIDSSTYEEAPPTLHDWLGQRSRWTKGYMQTALVHLREPVKFARAVGVLPFFGFVIFVLGAVLTSLLAPVFWLLAAVLAVMGSETLLGAYGPAVSAVSAASLIGGCGVLTLLAIVAPFKRKWLYLAPYGISVIVYWWLISAAAYKALWQLYFRAHYWEKTQHGLARRLPLRARWRTSLARLAPTIAVLACFAAQVANANPWPKEQGRLELISSLTLTKQEAGLASGSTNATSALHLEYGAGARSTLILDADVQQQTAVGARRTNFDNASAGVRTVLRQTDFSVVSLEGSAGVSGIRRSPVSPDIALNGRAEGRLMFGEGFELLSRHGFASAEAGWRWRGGAPADEFLLDFGTGLEPWASGMIMLQSFSIFSASGATGAYRRYNLSKLQLSLAQRLQAYLWVQAGVVGAIAGVDRGQTGAVFGFWWRF